MRKINKFSYEVKRGEQIKIEVVPTNFLDQLPSVEAVLDDTNSLKNSGTEDAPVFEFTVTKPFDDTHRVFMEFTFLAVTPDTACYQVTISGENDVGCPCGFKICKTNQTREPTVRFDVLLV